MKSSTRDNIEGNLRQAGGKIKQEAGEMLNDPEMAGEGAAQKVAGKAQEKRGDVKRVFNK